MSPCTHTHTHTYAKEGDEGREGGGGGIGEEEGIEGSLYGSVDKGVYCIYLAT